MFEGTKEEAREKIEALRAELRKNSYLYYVQDAPTLEDWEYDAMLRQLRDLENQFPEFLRVRS